MNQMSAPITIPGLLWQLKILPSYKGYRVLATAVKAVMVDEDLLEDVTKNLYPALAELYGTHWKNVEFNIRRCITICWERGGKEAYCEIAGEDPELAVKPKLREFICTLAGYMVRQGEP